MNCSVSKHSFSGSGLLWRPLFSETLLFIFPLVVNESVSKDHPFSQTRFVWFFSWSENSGADLLYLALHLFESPYLGKATAVAWVALPIPDTTVRLVFLCVQTKVWVPVFRIFNTHTDVHACKCTRGLYGHCTRACTESWPWEKNPLPQQGSKPASAGPTLCQFSYIPDVIMQKRMTCVCCISGIWSSSPRTRRSTSGVATCTQPCWWSRPCCSPSFSTSTSTLVWCWACDCALSSSPQSIARYPAPKGHHRHIQQPQPYGMQLQINKILWNFPCVQGQNHTTKHDLALEQPQVTCVERVGPVLFCAVCGSVAAHHSSDNSRNRLLTKWWTAQSSLIEKWRDKLACIKSEKSSRICTSMYQSV